MKKYRLMAVGVLVALLGVLVAPVAGHAATTNFRSGTTASVAKDEVVDSTAYLAGTTLTVQGDVKGDLYCAGQTVDISGTVEGDVICAAQNITISGNVLGNVRVAAQTVTLSGPVARSVTAFGQSVTLTSSAVVNNDVTAYGNTLQLAGKVGRDAVVGGESVSLEGTVGRDVTANDAHLTLGSTARVGGGLNYTSNNTVELATGAVVTGKTERHTPPVKEKKAESTFANRFWGVAYWFGAFLLFGWILLGLAPRTYRTASDVMVKQGGWALLAGVVALVMTPIVVVLLMVTVIGIPVAVALMFLWLIALVASYVYSGYAIGAWVASSASWKLKWPGFLSLLLGLVILAALMLIPVVGGLFGFLALVWGLGGIVMTCNRHLKARKVEPKAKKMAEA